MLYAVFPFGEILFVEIRELAGWRQQREFGLDDVYGLRRQGIAILVNCQLEADGLLVNLGVLTV